jgi:hypothetical protein
MIIAAGVNLSNNDESKRLYCIDVDVILVTLYQFCLIFVTIFICECKGGQLIDANKNKLKPK